MINHQVNFRSKIGLSILILVFSVNYGFTIADEPPVSNSEGPYHIGWVWPDSLPKLCSDIAAGPHGKLYVSSVDGILFCLHDNGDIIWTFSGDCSYLSAPIINDSLIFFLGFDRGIRDNYGRLFAIDLHGDFRWMFSADKKIGGKLIVSPMRDIYFHGNSRFSRDGVFCVSQNGEGKYIQWPDGVGNGLLLGFDSDDNLIVWDPGFEDKIRILSDKGNLLVSYSIDGYPSVNKTGENIIVNLFHSPKKKFMVAFDSNFNEIWNIKKDDDFQGGLTSIMTSKSGDAVFAGTHKGDLFKFNSLDGAFLWKCNMGDSLAGIEHMVLSDDRMVFAVSSRATISAVDSLGNLVWSHEMYDAGPLGTPVLTDKNELFVIQDGRLFKFTSDPAQMVKFREPSPAPESKSEAEKEIVDFLLENITDRIQSLATYIENDINKDEESILPPLSSPATDLIIYAGFRKEKKDGSAFVKYDKPVSVWLYKNGTLEQLKDGKDTIRDYKRNIEEIAFLPWSYGIYVFTITNISDDFRNAEIMMDHHCGSLCGDGSRWYLQRSPSGKWWIVKSEPTWIS